MYMEAWFQVLSHGYSTMSHSNESHVQHSIPTSMGAFRLNIVNGQIPRESTRGSFCACSLHVVKVQVLGVYVQRLEFNFIGFHVERERFNVICIHGHQHEA